MLRIVVVGAAAALPLGLLASSPATATTKTATVMILHAIPDTVVDVYVDDTLLIDDFAPGARKRVKVPGGTLNVELFPSDAPDSSGTALLAGEATVVNGKNYTVTANLTADGGLALEVWTNNRASIKKSKKANNRAGEGRLTVRHIGQAPGVTIYVDGEAVNPVTPLQNDGWQWQGTAKKGRYTIAAGLPGEPDPVVGPVRLRVRQGWNTIVYVWGQAAQAPEDTGYRVSRQYVKLKEPKK